MAALENAALDGTLFSNRSISPSRHSVDSRDEEDSEDDLSRPSSPLAAAPPASSHPYASSPSPRRKGPKTGPKGVIADQRSAKAHAAAQSRAELQSTRARQEKGAITASTVHDEDVLRSKMAETRITDQEKREEDDLEAKWRAQRMATLQAGRGGLREIGAATFLSTVERKGWALVLIYEPDVDRCLPLLAEATRLARTGTCIVRARAGALGFGMPARDETAAVELDDDDGEREADPDVLPTLLAYRDGDLERTWVRVDFDIGADGLRGLLAREGVISDIDDASDSDSD